MPLSSPPLPGPSPTQLDPLASALEERVTKLWWLLTRTAPSTLSRSSAATLARLREDGPQRIGALAAFEAVSQPTMTCLIQRLERDGLVARGDDPQDARAAVISITPAGAQALDLRSAQRADAIAPHLRALTPQQRATLADALGTLDELMAEASAR